MLTAIPPRLLHWIRDAALRIVTLAELGLSITCPCGGEHVAARWLEEAR